MVDLMMLSATIWAAIALVVSENFNAAIEPIGIITLQLFGAYLIGRVLVRNKKTLLVVVKFHLLAVVIMLPFAIMESLTATPYYLNFFAKFGPTYGNVVMEARLGLDRAQAGFEHPILYGVFCASGFTLAFAGFKSLRQKVVRWAAAGLITVSTFVSLSTGALLALTTQLGVICWGAIFRKSPKRWKVLGSIVATLYITVDILSNRTPFHVFVDYLTFNQGSAYNRILIWKFGTAEVARHPIFGLGMHLEEWERPSYMSPSMDNFWLVIALSYGLPAFFMLAGGLILLLFRAGSRRELDIETANLRMGIIVSLIGVFFGICSVHLWNATFCWFLFLAGSGVWILEEGRSAKEVKDEEVRRQREENEESARAARRPKSELSGRLPAKG